MRNRILGILKDADGYVSGEEMSHRLGISRAAVWKHINKLKSEGYGITSVTNRGYRLTDAPDALSPSAIKALLNTRVIARNIRYTDTVDSTNEEAKRHYLESDGTLFISERQSAGKGRLGHEWESPRGAGIWMSLLLKPDMPPRDVSQITLIAGIAVCRAVGSNAMIKWPNDIIIGTRKLCGILTEMSAEVERVNYIICGIGINVNSQSFEDDLKDKATSLFIETGKHFTRSELVAAVMNEFETIYSSFLRSGFASVREEYLRLCVTLGREVRVISRNKELRGRALDIDENGGLIIETDNGRENITSGEVSVRGIYGYI